MADTRGTLTDTSLDFSEVCKCPRCGGDRRIDICKSGTSMTETRVCGFCRGTGVIKKKNDGQNG
jgi:hypothetical protein